jgi:formylmethanofuran dehydrogenase subunit C
MKLAEFMDDAYQGLKRGRRLETRQGDTIFSLEDLADRVGTKPSRNAVVELVPRDMSTLIQLIDSDPGKTYQLLWGYLSSIAAERSPEPLHLPARDYAGLELSSGTIILDEAKDHVAKDHVGERMKGGRILVRLGAGDYLGQEMSGGGIIAGGVGDYAFQNMRGGFGVVQGDSGNSLGLGNNGGKIICKGNCGERAGWLMHSGSLRVGGEAGDYLGLLMSGGKIVVAGRTGKRAGWRMKGGTIMANGFGPEAADGVLGLD